MNIPKSHGTASAVRTNHPWCAMLRNTAAIISVPASRALRVTTGAGFGSRSEEHTSELQSQSNLVCRLLLAKKTRNGPNLAWAKEMRRRMLWSLGLLADYIERDTDWQHLQAFCVYPMLSSRIGVAQLRRLSP